MLADFLLKKAVAENSQGLTPAEQVQLMTVIEKHPDLFMRLAEEFKQKTSAGKKPVDAATEIFNSHAAELRSLGQ